MGLFGNSETVELTVSGMTCGSCVARVTDALRDVPGVKRTEVHLDSGQARVKVAIGTDRQMLVDAVRTVGYATE